METKKELIIERIYDAPRELVWKAWTDPEMVKQWWGPNGVTNSVKAWDAKEDGQIDLVMIAGKELGPLAGQEWPMDGTFTEVEEGKKLVYKASPIIDGKAVMDTLTTITFEEENGSPPQELRGASKTKMTVHIIVTRMTKDAEGPLSGMEMGWNQQLDKLGSFLKGQK